MLITVAHHITTFKKKQNKTKHKNNLITKFIYRARMCNFVFSSYISHRYNILLQLTFVRQPESIFIHTFDMHETPFVSISYRSFRLLFLQLFFSFCLSSFYFTLFSSSLIVNRLDTVTTATFFQFSGSRRPSLASVHSTSSSIKSYSAQRFEKELQQKELRQEMKLRLTRLQQQQQLIQNRPHIVITDPHVFTPGAVSNPLTPNSLDDLLPSVIEMAEVSECDSPIRYPPKTNQIQFSIFLLIAAANTSQITPFWSLYRPL